MMTTCRKNNDLAALFAESSTRWPLPDLSFDQPVSQGSAFFIAWPLPD